MTPLDKIVQRALDRRQRWQHSYVEELPVLVDLREASIVGSFSVIKMESRQRILKEDICIELPEGMGETPSAIARDYLTDRYQHGAILKHQQILDVRGGVAPMPLYAIPCQFEHGYYIDIRSCYWTMLQIVGWNVDYWPDRWLQPGEAPADFPFPDHKVARNCLVSSGIISDVVMWHPDKGLQQLKRGNSLANSQLYRLISDVLNAVADKMRALGVVYINCDGYIAPNYRSMTQAVNWLTDWGLPVRIKAEGRGEIYGAGSYRVGRMKSRRFVKEPQSINNVYYIQHADWLHERFARLAAIHGNR